MRLFRLGITRLPGRLDALVSSDDAALMASGGVSKDLRLAGGPAYAAELERGRAELVAARPSVGDVLVTGAGSLPARHVFHVVTVDRARRLDEASLAHALGRCLGLASERGLASIAFPALGAGAAGFAPAAAARILVDAIASYLRSGSSSLRSVSFAIPDAVALSTFDAEFTRLRFRSLGGDAAPRRSLERAILFSDIVGSTSFFDRMGDESGMQLLDRYHHVVLPLFSAHHGDVVKSMGDGQLVVFPDVEPAGRCAQSVLRALAVYNHGADRDWLLRARLGIHFGTVVSAAGDVFGDVVNSAQRIQSMAEPDQILLSAAARSRLGTALELRPLGARPAKGKGAPIDVFELPW